MTKVLWICGRPGSGKTTLLRELHKLRPELACFDADAVRGVLYPQIGFGDAARETNIRTLAWLANAAVDGGRCAVVAAVTPTEYLRGVACMEVSPTPFHLIHMTGRARELWEGSVYEQPVKSDWSILNSPQMSMNETASQVVDKLLPQPPRQLFIGRWQPFHKGHQTIVLEALKNGPVAIGVRQTCIGPDNPLNAMQRCAMIRDWAKGRDVEVFTMPDISSIHIGRDVGYDIVKHDAVPGVSGTELRKEM